MVIRIEMTMATIGRLMKNLDMAAYPLLAGAGSAGLSAGLAAEAAAGAGAKGFRIDGHSRANLLRSFGDDLLAGLQSLADDPVAADTLADGDRTDVDFVLGRDDCHQVLALDFGDGTLRHDERAFLNRHRGTHLAVLAGAEEVLRVREQRGDLEGAGAGVHLPVEQQKLSGLGVEGSVDEDQFERCRLAGSGSFGGDLEIFALADVEIDPDRIDGRHGGQFGRHARAEEVADLRLGDAGNAGHRRGNPGETEIQFRGLQRGVGGFEGCLGGQVAAGGVVEVLLTDGVHGRQWFDARQVGARRFVARRLLGAQSLGFIHGGLEGARVDLEQRLTLLHEVPFAVVLFDQVAGHLRTDDGIDAAVERSDPFHVDRHVPLRYRHHFHDRRRRRRRLLLVTRREQNRYTSQTKGSAPKGPRCGGIR
jgi:hypothetical protein